MIHPNKVVRYYLTTVPNTRKINDKPLSADITLTATDVGAIATVNGVAPDAEGNVKIESGSGCNVTVEDETMMVSSGGSDLGSTGKYELIDMIICDGTFTKIVKAGLSLKSAKIYLNMKPSESATSIAVECNNESGLFGYAWIGNCINTTERWAYVYVVSDGINAYVEYTNPSTSSYNCGGLNKTANRMNADTPINKISVYTSGGSLIPAESTIEIWGVRA